MITYFQNELVTLFLSYFLKTRSEEKQINHLISVRL